MLKCLIESDPSSIPDTTVVSLTSLGVIGESLHKQGIKVYALNLSPSGFNILNVLWQLVKLIRRYQPDIVQTWMYHADLLGGLAACLAGNKHVVWNIRIASVPASNILTIVIMKICASLSRWIPKKIICVAETAKRVHINYGYEASRMVVIANGFDFSNITATTKQRLSLRQACHFSENDIVIGWVGRFHPDKGQDNFVKAATIVIRHYPMVKFLLVGRDCTAKNVQLMNWLNDPGLQECFVLLGERNDIPACLAAMDIFCMPSSNEGFSNSLAEAMAMALPCVATDVGDTVVLVGDTVILVPPQDSQALAQGLLEVIALPEKQREQMGLRAKERVLSEFSIENARERFEAVYQDILENT
jgi:glycosyltransferase involved in cell wall biosynthesis